MAKVRCSSCGLFYESGYYDHCPCVKPEQPHRPGLNYCERCKSHWDGKLYWCCPCFPPEEMDSR